MDDFEIDIDDAPEVIKDAKGNSLAKVPIDYQSMVGFGTLIVGKSSSGKTTLMNNILATLGPLFAQIFCFCGSGVVEEYKKMIPSPFIMDLDDNGIESLNNIVSTRRKIIEAYRAACAPSNIAELFSRLPPEIQARYDADINSRKYQIDKLSEGERQDRITKLKILYIRQYGNKFKDSKDKMTALAMNTNYKTLIIFDDVTSELQSFEKSSNALAKKRPGGIINPGVLKDLFTKARHMEITHIYCLHSLVQIPKEIRSAVKKIVFTSPEVVRWYFENEEKSFSKAVIAVVNGLVFKDKAHTKLIYMPDNEDGKKFGYIEYPVVSTSNITLCGPYVRKMAKFIENFYAKDIPEVSSLFGVK